MAERCVSCGAESVETDPGGVDYCVECGAEQPEGEDAFRENPKVRFVNAYRVRRCYGGPEEGGWWYDAGELLLCEPHTAEEAEARAAELRAGEFSNEGLRPLSSVLSTGRFDVRVDARPGADWPDARPRYE